MSPSPTINLLLITAQHCKQEVFLEEVGQIPASQTGEPISALGNGVDAGAAGMTGIERAWGKPWGKFTKCSSSLLVHVDHLRTQWHKTTINLALEFALGWLA